jgi:hypothetical protein
VDTHLKPVPLYETAGDLAKELKRLAPILLAIRPAAGIAATQAAVDVRTFTDSGGSYYVFATNLNVLSEVTFELTFNTPNVRGLANVRSGHKTPVHSSGKVGLTLLAGEGELLRVLSD